MRRLKLILSLFTLCILTLTFNSFSQTGPGGVGNSSSNLVWLEADSITGLSDGDDITTWGDGSGNNLDFSQPNAAYKPILKNNILNNKPVVRFNKTNGRIRRTSFANFPTTEITTFVVNKNTENGDGVLSYASGGSNNDFLIFNSSSLNLYRGTNINSGIAINNDSWHIVDASWRSADGAMAFWIDGSESFTGTLQTGTSITQNGCLAIAGEQDAIDGSYDAGRAHSGDFAEVIVYNTYLNDAQRIIVANYLAAKYDLDISASGNNYYSYQTIHGNDVAGIGREDVSNTHTSAMSANILQLSNPATLDADKEYMFFGHDNAVFASWTTTEAPNSGDNIQRLAREWRVEETGDLGDVTFTIDTTLLPARPSGYTKYVLLVDADGDFSSGASVYEMLSPGTDEFFQLPGYNINSGDYVAIGTIVPTIEFSDSSPEEFETTNSSVDIVLNYISQSDVYVDYFTTDFTAIAPGDYTAIPLTTGTITAGTQSFPISITLVNDGASENDETFKITLTNQPADINIGPDNPILFTIHDDDNVRKIYFSTATSSDSENVGTAQVQITPSEFDPVNPTTVDYDVTGGTANGGGEDYTLASGTVVIPPNTISNTFDINITNDSYDEVDETIIISLSNPTNSSLSAVEPIVHTFTIQDNDNPPQVQFSTTTSNGNESTVSVSIPVQLSALSQNDVVVDYTVSGTASSGPDHDLVDGSITIPSGSLSANINFTVNDDSEIESNETVIITLTYPPQNAILGTITDHTYTILDNDTPLGYSGPGGVGDYIFNILWLEADSLTGLTDGENVTDWYDGSGNSSDLSAAASYSPVYQSGVVNGKPVVRFNKSNNRIRRTNFNNFPTSEITTFIVDNTNDNSDGLFSYASSSYDNDFLLFNSSNIGIYREMTDNSGVFINDSNWHILDVSWRSSDGADEVWLDGAQSFTSNLNAGTFITQNGCLALGGEQDAVDGGYTSGQAHNGDMAEVIVYNTVLNQAQRIIVTNYLAAKYNIDISASGNDYFAYEATHSNDVAGIGRVDSVNFHQEAESGGILRVGDPSSLNNGDYLLFGHDDASIASWTSTDVPVDSLKRITREWRFTETGNAGNVTITVDTADFPALPEGHEGYYLLVDADGTFAAGATVYPLTLSGSVYESSPIDITDGDFVTFAIKGVTAEFTITSSTAGEASGTADIEVKLSNTLSTNVTVAFNNTGGTATQGAGNDYTVSSTPVTILAGDLTANIVVTINDDSEIEVEENVLINLTSTSANASLGSSLTHTLTISDNDFSGFTGPGGVGDLNTNKLWIRADSITGLADGEAVSDWTDISGNNNDFNQGVAGNQPTYKTPIANGKPVVRFDGTTDYMTAPDIISGNTGRTIFITGMMISSTGGNDGLLLGLDHPQTGGSGRAYSITPEVAVHVNGNRVFNEGFGITNFRLLTINNPAGINVTAVEMYLDGVAGTESSSSPAVINTGSNGTSMGWSDHVTDFFNGDMAEAIIYDTDLNSAQRIIVENYLAAKYNIDISASGNDYYSFESTHGDDVSGIGRIDTANFHTAAQSSGIIKISNSSDLGDNEYLLFGHDEGDITTWTTSETPGDSIQRIEREWKLDETGNVGSITISLDTTLLPGKPTGYNQYVVWIDADGDFSSGATQYLMTKTADGYEVTGVDINDGEYISFGIFRPVIQYTVTTSNGFEDATPALIDISLNYPVSNDATVDYSVSTESTATGGGDDYTFADGTATITGGSSSTQLSIEIIDDGNIESDETIKITLSNPSIGITLGYDSTHVYTIRDNDNTRKIDFTLPASGNSEATTPAFLTIRINIVDNTNPTLVDYSVTGGTATSGVDYVLADGTATIPATEISTTVQIDVTNDYFYESDETIEVGLSNPNNANLGTNVTHTYTIQNDDPKPTVEFTIPNSNGSEGVTPANIEVGLSAKSNLDVTLDYFVNGGTATNGGVDYTLADGSLLIAAGDSLANISITLIDDPDVEVEETVDLLLANVNSNATLGAQTTHTFTINDNDYTGFSGPGGVGDTSINKLWLSADTLVTISGSDVTIWGDISGNSNDATNLAPGQEPDLFTDQINGKPAVRFDDNGGTNGDYLGANLSLGISGSGASTVFMVAKNTTTSDQDNTGLFIGQSPGTGGTVRHYGIEYDATIRFNNGNRIFNDGYTQDNWKMGMIRNASGYQYGQYEGYLAGVSLGETSSSGPTNVPNTSDDFYYLGAGLSTGATFSSSGYFEGDMAEIIVYNSYLNEAQRIIVENYLSSKYGLAVANDYYSYDGTHDRDVAGIGRVDASNIHTAAQSARIFKISNADDLDDGEYILFGHDNRTIDTWTTSETGGSEIRRINREWRLNKTGDAGAVTASVDTALLPAKTSGYEKYVLLVDSDGDFSLGATQYPLTLSGGEYVTNGISFNDGDFVTVGIIKTVVQFVLSTDNGSEGITPVSVEVEMNYGVDEDVTIDYAITGGSATNGDDYDLTDGTVIFTAGSVLETIDIDILEDAQVEPDENIILTLSNLSLGFIGNDTTHTFTINDNDSPRTAEFQNTDSTNTENVSPIGIIVTLSSANPSADSKIAYDVTGGTATGGGVDYTLPADTLVIAAGDTQDTIFLQITDDLMDEPEDTVIVSLVGTGSLNTNLGTNTDFTYHITDNDAEPTIQFSFSTSSGSESFQTVDPGVELSAVSGKDITVDYDVTSGTATSGVDFNLTPGTLTIPAGSTTDSIRFGVVDDDIEESTETVVVTLSNPTNATLGGNTSNFYSILDDDGLGWTGPGGVADSTQNKVWLSSTYAPGLNDGDPVSTWEDQTGNSHDATQSGAARPTYLNNGADNWNQRPVVRFNSGLSQYLGFANHPDINTGGPYDKRTIIIPFRTGIDVTTRQVVYEQGGTVRGLNIYIDGGTLYISGWNEANDDGGLTTPWAFTSVTSAISANTPYFAMLQFNFDGGSGDVTGFLNGDTLNILPGAGRLFNHPGNIGLGGMNNGSVFHDGLAGGYDHYFDGNISEFISSNIVYNKAQIIIINNYLGAKCNIPVTYDYFDHDVNHSWELFGIGQVDSDNSHNIARGSGIIRIENPSSLDDGDFLIIGHDNGDISSWTSTDVPDGDPNIQRVAREWRADDRNNGTGTVRLSVDDFDFAAKPFGFTKYVLLLNSSSDFTSGSQVYELTYNSSTDLYEADNIDLSNDMYFTIGVVKPAVEYSLVSSNGVESVTPVNIEVTMNYITGSDVTVDYAATGGTANSGSDYTLTPDQLTILAGNQTATYPLTIINDTDSEVDETVVMELSNPSAGVSLGTNTQHTYTINDDDNSRWIQFTKQDSTNLESVDPVVIQVHINEKDLSNDTKVAYEVTGGTASGGGTDYTLAADTVTVIAGDTLGDISISINDDLLDEADETIVVTLSGPVNANLGDTTVFTYTIQDDDAPPAVQFSTATSSGAESFSPVRPYVDISAASGQDIELFYSASGGSAINGGIDYTIINPSSIVIPAGSTVDSLEFSIFNDIIEEGDETVIITLDSVHNATLGGQVNHTYTIYDDDGMGWLGPGGVSDGSGYQTWLKSNAITGYSDGQRISTWADASGNNNDATSSVGNRPYYRDNITDNINERPVVDFSGGNYVMALANGADFNTGGSYTRKTLIVAFQTGGDVISRQVVYEQGGGTRGLNFYIEGGYFFIGGWNLANDGATTPWGFNAVNTPVGVNETHYAVLEFNSDSTWIKGYFDGNLLGTIGGVGKLFDHGGNIGIGAMNNGSYFGSDSASGDGYYFTGKITEFLSFNKTLNEAQKIIIENYFGAKYAIGITNEKYVYDGTYDYEVFGIGRESNGNSHIISQGSGIIKYDNPTSSDDGDYLFTGHDNGDISAWVTSDTPFDSIQRVTREWKVSETGNIGDIRFAVDTTALPAPPANYDNYVLLVDIDGDADFTTGTINFIKLDGRYAEFARASTLGLDDGYVYTIGVARNISIQTGDWNNPDTWLVNVPESDESVAIMNGHVVTLTADASVGALTIDAGGELQLGSYTLSVTTETINNAGIFTPQTGTINYSKAGNQCVAPLIYYNLSITGTGIKTLCGNIDIDHDLEMLGTATTLYLDADVANNYTINIAGDWRTRGTFLPQQGEVIFDGAAAQQILRDDAGSENFYNLTVNAGTSLTIDHNIVVGGTLTMNGGDIDIGTTTMTLGKDATQTGILTRNSGTIIGRFRRWVNSPADSGVDLIFPVGTGSYYRPLIVNFDNISTGGTLTNEFIATDPGNSGLPLDEGGFSIYNAFTEGYWPLTGGNGFAFSGNYDIDLVADGFTSFALDTSIRVLSRINSSSDWQFVGTHVNAIDTLIQRDNLNSFLYEYGIGSTAECTVSLTNCPTDINVNNDAGVCGAVVSWTEPTPDGTCSGVNMTSTHSPGDFFAVGSTTVTYYVTDSWGSEDSCKFDVIVADNEDPTITCASDQTQTADAGVCEAAVTVIGPATGDNCGVATVLNNFNGTADASGTYPAGTTNVKWTVTDIYGNTNTCIQDITVTDDEDPTLTAVDNRNEYVDASCNFTIPDYTGLTTASDNCAGAPVVTQNPVSTTVISGHSTVQTIWLIADDGNGNQDSTSFDVTLLDTISPRITCPADQTKNADAGEIYYTVAGNEFDPVSTSDNCGVASTTNDINSGATLAGEQINDGTTITWTVTDNSGNTAQCSFTVTVNSLPDNPGPIIASDDTVCAGQTGVTYAIDSVDRATSYAWTVPSGASIVGPTDDTLITVDYSLSAVSGDVIVTGVNANGNSPVPDTFAVVVNPVPLATLASSDPNDTICDGETITFTAGGGDLYEFFVDGTSVAAASTTNTYSTDSLTDGETVTVNVTDNNTTCSALSSGLVFTVNSTPAATLSSNDADNTICAGDTVIFTAGGGDTYEFFINGVSTQGPGSGNTLTTSTLSDGDIVNVEETNSTTGCSAVSSDITVTVNSIPSASIDSFTYPACYGESTGSITASASGGTSPYEFNIDGGTNWNSTGNFTNLDAGGYTVIVRDANMCNSSGVPATITEPSEIVISDTTITDLTCNGDGDGAINITVSGGNAPYIFNWITSDGSGLVAADEDQTGLTGGTYDLTVQDGNGCTKDFSFVVNEPEALQLTLSATDISCYGDADGQISADVTGGTGSYTYSWSDGQTVAIAVNLGAGDYTVTITDDNNCSDIAVETINEPDSIYTDPVITRETCPGTNDGAIDLNPAGGTGAFTILWSDGSTTEDINNVGADNYTLEVRDANLCTYYDTIEVTLAAETCLRIPTLFTPNGDGKNDLWRIESIHLYQNVTVEVYTRWGKLIYRSDNGYQNPWDGTFKGQELPMDSYHYIIDLGDGSEPIVGSITIVR